MDVKVSVVREEVMWVIQLARKAVIVGMAAGMKLKLEISGLR